MSNLSMLSMVMGLPDIAQLLHRPDVHRKMVAQVSTSTETLNK